LAVGAVDTASMSGKIADAAKKRRTPAAKIPAIRPGPLLSFVSLEMEVVVLVGMVSFGSGESSSAVSDSFMISSLPSVESKTSGDFRLFSTGLLGL
jgi:hypothetical protein